MTPRSIAIGHLIELYATADMSLEPRQQLCILLVQQLGRPPSSGVVEPGLQQLRTAIDDLPATVLNQFDKRLQSTTEPDDLWTLMSSLNELLQPTLSLDDGIGPIQLERSSVRATHAAAVVACDT